MGLWHTNRSPNLNQKTRLQKKKKKKRKEKKSCKIVDFAVPADHRIKLKESEKNYKYVDIAREFLKIMEHEGDDCINRDWFIHYSN